MKNQQTRNIAYFISPHGFGHAARASAVMEALHEINHGINFEIFTTVPDWFFKGLLSGNSGYHNLVTDIGLVQKTPLKSDITETVRRLDLFLPFDSSTVNHLSESIIEKNCVLVACDIAPMGIEVAKKAGVPSVLIENFTWDWLYGNYVEENSGLRKHIEYLRGIFSRADFHVQTKPVCRPVNADLTTLPVSRGFKKPAGIIRKMLKIPERMKVMTITMGGIQEEITFLKKLAALKDIFFIIPGSVDEPVKLDNVLQLPQHSDFFHPDLLNASDAVIGKVGYSTLSEVYYAGVPFGYIARKNFRESESLVAYIKRHMPGMPIDEDSFYSGGWFSKIPELLNMQRAERDLRHGASRVAEFIVDLWK